MGKRNILDILTESKRLPQVIMPKDAGLVVAYTGVCPGWKVLDVGTGSGWLAMFMANLVNPGKVTSYEKRKDFADNVKEQLKKFGFTNLKIINEDIFTAIIKGKYDLITVDMKDSEKILNKLYEALNTGGWIATYSPHIEQMKAVKTAMLTLGMKEVRIVENIVRDWKAEADFTHPIPSGIMHTGFLVVGRKTK
ncbi:MAG: methyltransferase domain-containing protein [Candidatus Aenigmarchaeota archaeon]|nr:methyltransferase domain-containing protein [Candidatus Aenigmarchaeota archaeon]